MIRQKRNYSKIKDYNQHAVGIVTPEEMQRWSCH